MTRTDQQRREIWKLVKEMEGKPYMTNTNTLMKSAIWSPQKFKRLLMQNREHVLDQRQKELTVLCITCLSLCRNC